MTKSKPFRVGIDTGGTFTDLVMMDETTGRIELVKMSSTPVDPSIAFMEVLNRCLKEQDLAADDCLHLVYGTTVATNTIIEGKGAKTALLITKGFRDVLEIGRQIRPRLYDLFCDKPKPLVPRRLCFEVPQRLDARGEILQPLDEAEVAKIADLLRQQHVESVVVCLLHSYANPTHERRVADIVSQILPEVSITLSSDLCSEMREYYRASTAAVNALLVPVVGRYVGRLEKGLATVGVPDVLHLMTSSGGILSSSIAREKPVHLVESGPAAGVISSAYLGALAGYSQVISFDMGGTTAKLGLVENESPRVAQHFEVGTEASVADTAAGYPVRTPVVDLVEIGAGGGSIAWIDDGGALRVGPRSAGAMPGPACYGNGQLAPTITDANVALGRINPDNFIGGEQRLDSALAAEAVRTVAEPLGMSLLEAAHGIVEIANTNMTEAARTVSVQRGFDPREFTLVAFGGAGPLHAAAIARELQIPQVMIPPHPGVASALGLLVGDIKHDFVQACLSPTDNIDLAGIEEILRRFQEEATGLLTAEHVAESDREFIAQTDLRFQGQSHELTIDLPNRATMDRDEFLGQLHAAFCDEHERVYGFADRREASEMVNVRLTAVGRIRRPTLPSLVEQGTDPSTAVTGHRSVYFAQEAGQFQCAIYDRKALTAGNHLTGPAIVEEYDSTTVIPPDFEAEVDTKGNLILRLKRPTASDETASDETASDKTVADETVADETASDREVRTRSPPEHETRPRLGMDPIRFEVMRSAFNSAAEEMGIALRRAAYSTNIKTRADFSCALYDDKLRVVSQSFSQPIHLASMVRMIPAAVREFGVQRLRPGDGIAINDPHRGAMHLNDIGIIVPLFHQGRLVGFTANVAHHVDIGGLAPGGLCISKDIYQEGVIIPPTQILQDGEIIDNVFNLIVANIRSPKQIGGDFCAQVASAMLGQRRVCALHDRFGTEAVGKFNDELMEYTRRWTKTAISKLPRGEFYAECELDDDGVTDRPIKLAVKAMIGDGEVHFDLAGSDAQRRSPMNANLTYSYSALSYVVRCLIDPDIPINDGFYSQIHVTAPAGTVVNAVHPAGVMGGNDIAMRLADLGFKALAEALPDKVTACSKSVICNMGCGGVDPRSGDYYTFMETLAGGYGARPNKDGIDAVQAHIQNTENSAIEETENNYPIRITRYELVPDSEGAGRQRGGLGLRRDWQFPDHEATLTVFSGHRKKGPWGLFGGHAGKPSSYTLNPAGEARELASKITLDLAPDDIVSYRTPGGGGYGDPSEREPQDVLQDVLDGKVSVERARNVYGVAVDTTSGTIDVKTTQNLRNTKRNR